MQKVGHVLQTLRTGVLFRSRCVHATGAIVSCRAGSVWYDITITVTVLALYAIQTFRLFLSTSCVQVSSRWAICPITTTRSAVLAIRTHVT